MPGACCCGTSGLIGWCEWASVGTDADRDDAVTICPVAGLVTVEGLVSDDAGVDDSSMLDMADASSRSFSSDSWERIDFIPLD